MNKINADYEKISDEELANIVGGSKRDYNFFYNYGRYARMMTKAAFGNII